MNEFVSALEKANTAFEPVFLPLLILGFTVFLTLLAATIWIPSFREGAAGKAWAFFGLAAAIPIGPKILTGIYTIFGGG